MGRHGPEGNPLMGSFAGSVTRRIYGVTATLSTK